MVLLKWTSLIRDKTKAKSLFTLISHTLDKGFAAEVPPLPATEKCWNLFIYGVYHPQKAFPNSRIFWMNNECQGTSLYQELLTGPNLTYDLLWILLRFRQGPVTVAGDIQQMFYGFYVESNHLKYFRFFGTEQRT